MILDTMKTYECRFGLIEEFDDIYSLLEPLVCDESEHKSITEMIKRKLQKYLKHAIKTQQCLVVAKDGIVTSAYAGDKDMIVYFGTRGVDVTSTTLLMHNVLNRVHNRFKESVFQVVNKKQRDSWEHITAIGSEATEISPLGIGVVKVEAKDKIERLYNALKGQL